MKRKVIIDTDPGIDDALALMFAFKHPDVEILGITSVAGNKGLNNTTVNSAKMSTYFGSKVNVYPGVENTYTDISGLQKVNDIDFDSFNTHGEDGLGSVTLDYDKSLILEKDAVTFILETVRKYPNEVDIIALGPLTNLAFCVEKDEETMKKVKSIHSMGGGIFQGNMTPVSEFNYWFDPHAVNKVFEIGDKVPIYMVGLDLTNQAVIDMNDLAFIKLIGGDLGSLINNMVKDYVDAYWNDNRLLGIIIHDLTTIVGYTNPEIYLKLSHSNMRCVTDNEVAYGQCLVDLVDSWKLEKNAYIPLEIDVKRYKELIVEILFGEDSVKEYRKI